MAGALALSERGRGRTAPNPNVGCVIVTDERVVGRGWTQPGGRPHAEAVALEQAGASARGATAYVTLEPCAHVSPRGQACSDLLIEAGVARVVAALTDPDPRTAGQGFDRLRDAGVAVTSGVRASEARAALSGFLIRRSWGRPHVTLKLATSADGRIATPPGQSQWIAGPAARAHGHLERARHEAILVGRGTFDADAPRLDVRLPGLEARSPRRFLLTRHPREGGGPAPCAAQETRDSRLRGDEGRAWETLSAPQAIGDLEQVNDLLVEGGGRTAEAFLAADLVDRLLWYRAPVTIGAGEDVVARLGLDTLDPARWRLADTRRFGDDRLEIYVRIR